MKRLFGWIILLAILTSTTVVAAPQVMYHPSPGVTVEINPNSELLGIIYYLAFGKNDTFVIDRGDYLKDVEAHFGAYRNHPAVQLLRENLSAYTSIPERDYRLMDLEYYLLFYTAPPNLTPVFPMGPVWFREKFIPALRDFARRTNFMDFYRSHASDYWEDMKVYTGALRLLPPDGFMTNYSGFSGIQYRFEHPFLVAVHGHSFNPVINRTQIWGAGGMLPLVRRTPQRTLWSYKTARDTMFGLPLNRDVINSTYLDELLYLGFIYHELGHDVTLPSLYRNYALLGNMTYFQRTIEEDMPYLARYDLHFWDPTGMLYEGFADAWEDFALTHVDGNYSLLAMEMQKAWGEFWIEELFYGVQDCALEVREGYVSDFSVCVPKLLHGLINYASPENASRIYEHEVPVTPLRAFDRGAQAGKVIVVYGTENPDPSGTEYDRGTAERIAKTLEEFYSMWPGEVDVEVKADVNVTGDDMKGNLVLVGGPVSNSIVNQMEEKFPLRFVKVNGSWELYLTCDTPIKCSPVPVYFTIDGTKISRSAPLYTNNASVIMAIRNPNNPENYIVWIAGADRNLTRLFTNPTYYLSSYEVYDGKEVQVGFYVQPLLSSGG